MRLKRSSPLLFDKKIREEINLRINTLKITNEPPFFKSVPSNTTITLHLIEHCTKRDSKVILKELGSKTIVSVSSLKHINAYTDESSDFTFTNGGAGALLLLVIETN